MKLVYNIKSQGIVGNQDIAARVAEALKKRVDPDGVRNLVWRPQGNTLEIWMPLLNGVVLAGFWLLMAGALTLLVHRNLPTIRAANGISSPASPSGNPLPSHRSWCHRTIETNDWNVFIGVRIDAPMRV